MPTRTLLFLTTALAMTSAAQAATPPQSSSGNDIVVTGTREQATALKKNAAVVLDARSSQEIRSLPDVNAAEALQRIPGIQMESDTGEGRFVNIRGLDADLNAATYDGVRLTASNPATPQGGGRAVAFDAFPSGMLGGIEVIKTLTPDMDAEGLGGVVNILPRAIPEGNTTVLDAEGGVGYEPLRGTARYQGDMTAGATFGDGMFSLIGSYAYNEDHRSIDDVEADYINDPTAAPAGTDAYVASKIYDDLQPRRYTYHRIRHGFSGGLTFQPSDTTQFYVRGIHAGYTEYANKHEFVINGLADHVVAVDNNSGDVTVDSASLREKVISTKEIVRNDLIEAGGRTQFGRGIKLDFRGAYTKGRDVFPYGYSTNFTDPNDVTLVYNNTANPRVPTFHTTDGTDITDPSIYTDFKGDNGPSYNSDSEKSGVINLAIPVGFGSDAAIKVGGSVRARKRLAHAYAADFNDPGRSYAAFSGFGNEVYYNGAYNIGPYPDYSKVEGIPQGPLSEDLSAYEDDNENVYAGYAQYRGGFGPISVVGGVRVEATDATYRANTEADLADGSSTFTLTPSKRRYTNIFPDIDFRYSPNDNLVVHAGFSTAIGRPGFDQITAARSIDVANDVVSQGNPDLKPTTGKNFDASVEYYTGRGGMISFAVFYKAFSNYIIPTVQHVDSYPDPRLANPAGKIEIDSFQNIGSAHAEGLEAAIRQQFLFLPGWLSGFGVDGNVTLVGSHGALHQDPDTGALYYHTLPQTSPFAANASLFYDKHGFQAKIAGSYVSKNIFAVGDSVATDVYSQPRFRLDASAAIDITPRMSFFVEAKNLTNTKLEFTQTPDSRYPIQREFYKPDYLAGVRIRLGH
ncbi:TonB-dependent receptor [Hephaestia mangrovi]|uniref:TonB-dependent receptor n=1 Tax=Hephaestia mangrovi TaxID=2873268 RepID=UPI001CA6F3AE|nr:TonB-dependent receptor [Hephaestia mangrovi]